MSIREVLTVKKAAHTPEQIVQKLRGVERIATSEGVAIAVAAKRVGIAEYTYYRWRKQYGQMPKDDVKRLKVLERENARLKRLLAEKELDNSILREVVQGKY